MNPESQSVIVIFLLAWLIIISFLVLKIFITIRSIFSQAKDRNIISVLDNLVKDKERTNTEVKSLSQRIALLEELSLSHIHKIGLVRFNPFGDTGGEQSFILALLDYKNTGLVLSGLYSRSGMRWYIKKVLNGKGFEHDLSSEEKKAVEQAK